MWICHIIFHSFLQSLVFAHTLLHVIFIHQNHGICHGGNNLFAFYLKCFNRPFVSRAVLQQDRVTKLVTNPSCACQTKCLTKQPPNPTCQLCRQTRDLEAVRGGVSQWWGARNKIQESYICLCLRNATFKASLAF